MCGRHGCNRVYSRQRTHNEHSRVRISTWTWAADCIKCSRLCYSRTIGGGNAERDRDREDAIDGRRSFSIYPRGLPVLSILYAVSHLSFLSHRIAPPNPAFRSHAVFALLPA